MKNRLLWLASGLLLVVCIYLFFALFEPYHTQIDTGWDARALRNPYLAAQQFLERQGIATQTLNSLNQNTNLDEVDTLFVEDSSDVLSPRRMSVLMDWLRGGGHIIVAAHHGYDENESDPLLSAFKITIRFSDDSSSSKPAGDGKLAKKKSTPSTKKKKKTPHPISEWLRQLRDGSTGKPKNKTAEIAEQEVDPDRLTTLRFEGVKEDVRVLFRPRWTLSHPALYLKKGEQYKGEQPIYWSGSESGTHFMQFYVGKGLLSVMSDPEVWRSRQIGKLDHAYLLSILVGEGSRVYFLVGNRMPSIFSLAWRHGREIIIALAVWLVLWLLYRGRRFLPPRQITVTARRSIAEHIHAVANFLWQRGASDELLATLREEIQRRASLVVHGYAGLSDSQRMRALSDYSGIPEQAVLVAMSTRGINNEEQFTQAVQSLQKIRSTL